IDPNHKGLHIYLSPKGKQLNQEMVIELAKNPYLILLCGHYEGVDQRAIDKNIDIEISIGDYVLMGGELPAMVLIEAVSRYIPKVLHSEESTAEETFIDNLLEYPQYTRPFDFEGDTAPDVLISGNHENVKKWRYNQRVKLTEKLRPDLLKKNNKI
ncbi:MAG: tRNA (guanosine(37)-N1)-methyltransferase TrmD, partial [Clostridia bacterium]